MSDNPADRLRMPGGMASLFQVAPQTVIRWAAAGCIASRRTAGGPLRFLESAVRAVLEDEAQGAKEPPSTTAQVSAEG